MDFNPVEIIKKKRDGGTLTEEEIRFFISSFLTGQIPEYQMSALLMAIHFNGLNDDETLSFVRSYVQSGKTVDLSFLNKPKIDKHSTGGVGDKTSLILAPLLACFDVVVPMMSGRGLGHTGGTLDKLESITGFRIDLSVTEFVDILKKLNVCMIGQTDDLAPADKKIYALRDVTATVDDIGLITASILSKKIAEGAEGIVYDVKMGSGANLPDTEKSRELAYKLLETTRKFGKEACALLTDMNEPLGYAIGNWLEVEECISIMDPSAKKSHLSEDLIQITLTLGGAMLMLAKKCEGIQEGFQMCEKKLFGGECFAKFVNLVELQGGNVELMIHQETYPAASSRSEIRAFDDGFISLLDALAFGTAAVNLGSGRMKADDKIDNSAGILLSKKVGDRVNKGETICELFAETENRLRTAESILNKGIGISKTGSQLKDKIIQVID
jgi:pyrimidine-nucleoside phosphorylase